MLTYHTSTFLNELVDSYASLVSRRREAYLTTLSLKVLEMGAELQIIPLELAGFGGNLSDSTFPYIAHELAKFNDFAEGKGRYLDSLIYELT